MQPAEKRNNVLLDQQNKTKSRYFNVTNGMLFLANQRFDDTLLYKVIYFSSMLIVLCHLLLSIINDITPADSN